MKKNKIRSFRLSEDLDKQIVSVAEKFNITSNQLIELAIFRLLNLEVDNTKEIVQKAKKVNQLRINLNMDNPTFKKLVDEVNKKNSTFSQEVLYRLSASLDNPVFEQQEYNELRHLWSDLTRLGNLIKMAINQEIPFDNDLLNEVNENVKLLKDEVRGILLDSSKRTFKGGLK